MKNLTKFLRSARKMEARQVARRANEVEDVSTFDWQQEQHRQHQFNRMFEDEDIRHECEQYAFEPLLEADSEIANRQNEALAFTETFEQEILESRQYAENNAFDRIAEIQGFDFEEQRPHTVKQLPAASSDLFANTFTEVTESHLETELTQNKQAITPWKEKVRTALIHQEQTPSSPSELMRQDSPDASISELSAEQIQEALRKEDELKKTRPTNSVFYFRSPGQGLKKS